VGRRMKISARMSSLKGITPPAAASDAIGSRGPTADAVGEWGSGFGERERERGNRGIGGNEDLGVESKFDLCY
jgi:hypothetical protein